MKTSIIRFNLSVLMALALAGFAVQSHGQTTSKTPPEKKTAAGEATNTQASAKGGPFRGKLAAVDKIAKTIVVGRRTFQITSETKIKKVGKPATLDDGVVGETVSGYVKPGSDGKLVATTVNFGPKPASESGEKQKAAPQPEKQDKQEK